MSFYKIIGVLTLIAVSSSVLAQSTNEPFIWSTKPLTVIAPTSIPEFTAEGFMIPESVESYTTDRSHPQRNGYCSMMARLNLYRLVKDPRSTVARGDAVDLINALLREDETTRIDTTPSALFEAIEAYRDIPTVIDMYPYVPSVKDDGTRTATNTSGLSYSSPHRAIIFNSEDGGWRVIDPFRGDGTRRAQPLDTYLESTITNNHRIVLAVAPVEVRTFSDTYTNTLSEDITRGVWQYISIPGMNKHGFIYSGVEKDYTTDQGNIFVIDTNSSIRFPLNMGVGSCEQGICGEDDSKVIEGRISDHIDTFGSDHGLLGGIEVQGVEVPTFESGGALTKEGVAKKLKSALNMRKILEK